MMQMLVAGGLAALTDEIRKPDPDNPRGYYEWEVVKQLPSNPALIAGAEGKVVKVISTLLLHLPQNHEYRVVFLRRPIEQVLASQVKMIACLGRPARPAIPPAAMETALETHLNSVLAWLSQRPAISVHYLNYPDLVANPLQHAGDIVAFLGNGLDPVKMAARVDSNLFRNR